ncbi:MAG: hypothetical protein WB586_02950 [Chthoniobacterales bacterium]
MRISRLSVMARKAMSKGLLPILACIVACLALSAFSVVEPLHYRLASDPTLRGKAKDGQCMDYAIALSSRLAAHGIHGQLIYYRWHITNSEIRGKHVFVMYHLPDNTKWVVDNEIPHPRSVPADSSPMQMVFLLSNTRSAPVEVELQEGLSRLSHF